MSVNNGICNGGPLHGKVRAVQDKVVFYPDTTLGRDGGFYVYKVARGPTPGEWRWVAPGKQEERR